MYEVSRDHSFSAAHSLRGYGGKCEALHGHNWKVRVHVRALELDHLGMVVDFKELKEAMSQVLGTLDHCHLNEVPPFDQQNPSAENLARYVAEAVNALIANERYSVHRCVVWESDGSRATFFIQPW